MMRGAVATATILLVVNVVRTFDIVIAMTGGGPGISTQMPATYVIDNINSRNVAQGVAAATCMHALPILALILIQAFFRWRAARKGEGGMSSITSNSLAIEPSGPKPKRLTPARVGLYAFLLIAALFFLVPLIVMLLTSMKSMNEIRGGNIFALPMQPTFDYWVKAWSSACTGRDCFGSRSPAS